MADPVTRLRWEPIIEEAAQIVDGYPYLITLRQLHYRLVAGAVGGYQNTDNCYKRLSSLTAEGRREGMFPALLDQTREIHRASSWTIPEQALADLASWYRRDRTEGQTHFVVLGGEKATLLAQLRNWFDELGLPIVLLRGYGSQTYVDDVARHVHDDGRSAVLVYAGDLDPSGEDILRDFLERCDVFDDVNPIAVKPEQVATFGLVENPGKATDSRAAGFVARHGKLIQVEVEAIAPDDLRVLYQTAISELWDTSAYDEAVERERRERAWLHDLAEPDDD